MVSERLEARIRDPQPKEYRRCGGMGVDVLVGHVTTFSLAAYGFILCCTSVLYGQAGFVAKPSDP
jgi:hypothetical protein